MNEIMMGNILSGFPADKDDLGFFIVYSTVVIYINELDINLGD